MGSRSRGREHEETDAETEQIPRAPGRVICLCLCHSLNSDHDPALDWVLGLSGYIGTFLALISDD